MTDRISAVSERSAIREILDHGDELAKRFEDYEPAEGDERPVEEYLLECAALAAGIPWVRIGELLGTSAQAAQQRYGAVVEQV